MDTNLMAAMACIPIGLVVGSFLTVVIDRVPRDRSIANPLGECRACGRRLHAPALTPIMSGRALRGGCRSCGEQIGSGPLVIAIANAALFALFGLEFGADVTLIAFCVLGAALVALVWIDLHEYRLPREITETATVISGLALTVAALVHEEPERIAQAALGAALALAIMGVVYLLSRGGLGEGDVRLAPLLGMHLGYLDPALVPIGLFLGFLFGAAVAVVALIAGAANRRTALPFGPFLAAGTVSAVFVGHDIVDLITGG